MSILFARGVGFPNNIKSAAVFFLVANVFLVWAANSCFAGAWTEPEGGIYEKVSMNYLYSNAAFDLKGGKTSIPGNGKFTDMNLGNYVEYGLSDRLTVINSLYLKKIDKKDDFQAEGTYGNGDVDLALKYKIFDDPRGVFSSQALVKIPGLYDKNNPLPLGNGQVDFELRFLYGLSLERLFPGYCNFEAGYRWRAEAPGDEVRYLVEFGGDFTRKFYGRIKLDAVLSMRNNDNVADNSGNPVTSNEYDLGKLDMALGYKISEKFGVEGDYVPSVYGTNTAVGTTYSLSIIYSGR